MNGINQSIDRSNGDLEGFVLESQMPFSFVAVFGQVDAARGSEEMVERLIEQNLNLEDKLRDASEQIDDCEALSAMNNEMLELANKDSRKLREDGDMARSEASQLKLRITELQQTIADSTVTLHKFRDLTRQLQASLIQPNIFFIFFFKNSSRTSTLIQLCPVILIRMKMGSVCREKVATWMWKMWRIFQMTETYHIFQHKKKFFWSKWK